ncbi:hypothetical protein GCM10007147_22680 [Nocardiopsis kunsanensis]|uniref:Uncharacterized protein n=1 Tax=Nocardiopsis kunsanensis TaxID=141693 RepID=A0A919CH98_9ACTN|nr:hypothetical protein GCM10007147_22680 [Nocardiopsis kunsanensis]
MACELTFRCQELDELRFLVRGGVRHVAPRVLGAEFARVAPVGRIKVRIAPGVWAQRTALPIS